MATTRSGRTPASVRLSLGDEEEQVLDQLGEARRR